MIIFYPFPIFYYEIKKNEKRKDGIYRDPTGHSATEHADGAYVAAEAFCKLRKIKSFEWPFIGYKLGCGRNLLKSCQFHWLRSRLSGNQNNGKWHRFSRGDWNTHWVRRNHNVLRHRVALISLRPSGCGALRTIRCGVYIFVECICCRNYVYWRNILKVKYIYWQW